MPGKKIRVVIDTNLWVSFLLSREFVKLDWFFNSNSIVLCFSKELLEEFIEVAGRSKFKKYFSQSDFHALLMEIHSHATFFEIKSGIYLSRDPKDDFLLSLAKAAKADYLLTGDKDLLVLKKISKTRILRLAEFLEERS